MSKSQAKKSNPSCVRGEYVYILSIKRNIYKSLEIIGVYSTIAKAKEIVINTFNDYIKILKDSNTSESEKILSKINDWKYNNKKWEHSKQDKRFYFYALSPDLNSFYQIIKLKLDAEKIVQSNGNKNGNKISKEHMHVRKETSMNVIESEKNNDETPKTLVN